MNNSIKIIVKIALVVLFILCLLDMPYRYFQLVRTIGMTCFIWFAYLDSEKKNKSLMIIWICSAIIINPIFKIALGRTMWNAVDVVWAIIILASLQQDFNKSRKKN